MNILVLSDLHIDTSDNFGTFRWKEKDFIEHLEYLRSEYSIEKVIFNGDIFELVKYAFKDVKKANPLLMKYFKDKDFVFIRGNHDIVTDFGIDHYDITNSSGQVIHIEHGHNADWLNGTRTGRLVGIIGYALLKKMSHSKRLMDIYFRIVQFREQLNVIPKSYNTLKYLTYALRLLKLYDVVILSHTHELESHHTYYLKQKKRYLNSGTCSLGRFQCIIMNTETLEYELVKEDQISIRNSSSVRYAI